MIYLLRRVLCATVVATSLAAAHGQSDFDLTQRWFNETLYNPASAGNSFSTGIFLHTRQQWLGFSGAPSTHAGTFDTYIESLRSGFGLTFAADRIGSVNSYNLRLAYAFYIPTGEKSALSLGLSGGLLFRNRRLGDTGDDPAGVYGNVAENSPDFDFGIEYRGPFKIGASVRHLASQPPRYNLPKHSVNIWAYVSSRFNLSENISIEPVASLLGSQLYRIEAGVLMYFLKNEKRDVYNDRFWAGALVRTGQGVFALLAGINITPKLRIGYSFDYVVGDLSTIAKGGTHELFMSFHMNRMFYKDETCPAYKSYAGKRRF